RELPDFFTCADSALGPQTRSSWRSCLPGMRRLSGQGLLRRGDRGLVKEVPMDPVAFLIDLVWGCPQCPQDGFREGQGDFPLTRVHAVRPGLVQGRNLTHISRASEDPDGRVQLPGQPDDPGTGRHTSGAENEAASPAYAGTLQRLTVARVAVYR